MLIFKMFKIKRWYVFPIFNHLYHNNHLLYLFFKTRRTFQKVPMRRIRLSFVECAYSDHRNIFFIILEV